MEILRTELPDVVVLKPTVFGDHRGFFMETFRENWFARECSPLPFVQENHSGSTRWILRGLHYQIKQTQGKLLRVIAGEVYDVAVDLRRSSPTFGKWVGVHLSAQNRHQIWVPPQFAHGFLVLSEWAEVLYKVTDYYAPEHERSLLWNDPQVGVQWPLPEGQTPILSEKDRLGKTLQEAEVFP